MKRILRYFKNRKGFSIVLLAIGLAVMFMIAGVAIDLSYMYYVKNQLQVAADAAALAGAAELPDITKARQTAWRFACKNKAGDKSAENANAQVYLVTNNPSSCDAALDAVDLNNSNDPKGDIVVGNWNPNRAQTPEDLRFCAYNDTCWDETTMIINAVKARPRRTKESETYGMPPVRVFLGKIFKLPPFNADWSSMSVSAKAIGGRPLRATGTIALCNGLSCYNRPSCNYNPTSITEPCELDPHIILETGDKSVELPHEPFAWTTLLVDPTSASILEDLMCGNESNYEVCDEQIWSTMGTDESVLKKLESVFADPSTPKDADGGWWIVVPVTQTCPPGQQGKGAGYDPKMVSGYAKIRVKIVCAAGVGHGTLCPNRPYQVPQSSCSVYNPYNKIIVIDRILCISCAYKNDVLGLKPVLVK